MCQRVDLRFGYSAVRYSKRNVKFVSCFGYNKLKTEDGNLKKVFERRELPRRCKNLLLYPNHSVAHHTILMKLVMRRYRNLNYIK